MTTMLIPMLVSLAWMAGDEIAPLIPRVEHAVTVGSVEQLLKLREVMKDASARYTLAYVDWRLFPLVSLDPAKRKSADGYLAEAEKLLKQAVAANPKDAEAQALLATVYGQQIGTSA